MDDRKALGRGLGALLPGAPAQDKGSTDVPLHLVDPNPYQPRQYWDDQQIDELALSIREHGLIQPVILRPNGERYQIVAGERRCRAARRAGLQCVPALLRNYNDREMLELALVENLQRQNLNPVETARAYRRLMDDHSYTQEDISRCVGRSRPAVANTLRLLSLSEDILEMLAGGALTEGQARPLLSLARERQSALAREVVKRKLTARQVERLAAGIVSRETSAPLPDPHLADAIERLQHRLGTEVKVRGGKAGEVAIKFFSAEDLERIVEIILGMGK